MATVQEARTAVQQAEATYVAAGEAYNAIAEEKNKRIAAIAAETDDTGAALGESAARRMADEEFKDRLNEAQRRFNTAEQAYQTAVQLAEKAANDAAAKAQTPEEAARIKAQAQVDAAEAEVTLAELAEYKETAPERRQAAADNAAAAHLKHKTAQLEYDEFYALSPQRRARATEELKQLRTTGRIGESNARVTEQTENPRIRSEFSAADLRDLEVEEAEINLAFLRETNEDKKALLKEQLETTRENLRRARALTTQEEVAADYAEPLADINLAVQQEALKVAQRGNRQAPTDEDVAEARRIVLEQSKADVAGTAATTESTQAGTAQTRQNIEAKPLGKTYGLGDQLKAIKDSFIRGEIDESTMGQLMNDYVATTLGTTTPFEREKEASRKTEAGIDKLITQRATDSGFQQNKLNQNVSMAADALRHMESTAGWVKKGSADPGKALGGLMRMQQGILNQYQPAPQVPAFIPPSAAAAPPPAAAAPAPPPAATPPPGAGGGVTINIGGGLPTNAPEQAVAQQAMAAQGVPWLPSQGQPGVVQPGPAFRGAGNIGQNAQGPDMPAFKQPMGAQDMVSDIAARYGPPSPEKRAQLQAAGLSV